MEKIKLSKSQRARMGRLIKNLESGKYKQTRNTLRQNNGFCCLGVACNMLVIAKMGKWEKTNCNDNFYFITAGNVSTNYIPEEKEILFGFKPAMTNGDYNSQPHCQYYYAKMNDDGRSFLEIAAELRKNFGFKPRKENETN